MNAKLIDAIVTCGGLGRTPLASGTVASFFTCIVAWPLHLWFGGFALLAFSLLIFGLGVWASKHYLATLPPERQDPREIVIDEVAGQMLLLSTLLPTWQSYMVGFLVFRFFDIVKPWPVSWADKQVKGAIGVMLDDMLAGFLPIVALMVVFLLSMLTGMSQLVMPVMELMGR